MISTKRRCTSIENIFKANKQPAKLLPLVIMSSSLLKRPGLSAMESAAKVISSQSDFGAPTSAQFSDGTNNMMNQLIYYIIKEVYRAFQEDANIQVVVPPGSITSIGQGENAGGPVIVTSTNNIGRASAQII